MKYGWIKSAAASPELRVADCEYNVQAILRVLRRAEEDGVVLMTFPELSLTGSTCGDLFFQQTLLEGAEAALKKLVNASAGMEMLFFVGLPVQAGGLLYNCGAAICGGRLLGLIPKTNLSRQRENGESRYFAPAPSETTTISFLGEEIPFGTGLLFRCEKMADLCVGCEIGDDLWASDPPSRKMAESGATVIVCPGADCEAIGKAQYRRKLVAMASAKQVCAYLYAGAGSGESTTDAVFSGQDLLAENGKLLAEARPFGEGYAVSEPDVAFLASERRRLFLTKGEPSPFWEISFSLPLRETKLTRRVEREPFIPLSTEERAQRCEEILTLQAYGLKKRLDHTNCSRVVIGISGGLDSTLALLAIVRAFDLSGRDRKGIVAVTMPCFGTSGRTKGNAISLCEGLGVTLRTVEIAASVTQHFADIGHDPSVTDTTYENAQARERTQVLMDISNQIGGLVIGTGDLSELALGWATYNGDHMSMYGINGGIPKTLVRHIVRYAAERAETAELRRVLADICDTPVSPELLPADADKIPQKTEDIVGPYQLHDFFLYHMVRNSFSPGKIFRMATYTFADLYTPYTVFRWLRVFCRRFFAQQFKRSCLPDGVKIGSVSLSPRGDFRMPSDASAALWMAELERLSEVINGKGE
ncbi:MAG: NAD(+) synthase [Ruminococcaceae bacterium]|nr:NAD(+) synthase [Oscillospiraceae bacterium]